MKITDIEEEQGYGSNSIQSAGSSLLNSIKQRSTVVDSDTGEILPTANVPKIKANVESSKLRQLLNTLPSDDEF